MTASPEKFWLADAKKLGLANDYILIMDTDGNVIAKSKNVTKSLLSYFKNIKGLSFNKNMFFKTVIDNNVIRIITVPYFYNYREGYIIAVASIYGTVESTLWRHFLFILAQHPGIFDHRKFGGQDLCSKYFIFSHGDLKCGKEHQSGKFKRQDKAYACG